MVHGEPVPLDLGTGRRPTGFFATRFVEAESSEQAAELALDLIRADRRLREIVRDSECEPATLGAQEIQCLETFAIRAGNADGRVQ